MSIKMVPDGTVERTGRKAARGRSGQHVGMKMQAVLLR